MPPFWINSEGSKGSSTVPNLPLQASKTLHTQYPTYAPPETKIKLTILATALIDALGGPAEFHGRFSFPFVDSMIPNENFNLPPGVWTDDTSMTLCLADSLATYKPNAQSSETGGFDELHQLELYNRWRKNGHLSAIGRCFDIGSTINQALSIFDSSKPEDALAQIHSQLSSENYSGNGSLMRVVPIGLVYWNNKALAREYARRSSQATHPSRMCLEVCEMWTGAITTIMAESTQASRNLPITTGKWFSKLDLLEYISTYPYTHNKLGDALACPSNIPPCPEGDAEREAWYLQHHPLLRLVTETQQVDGASAPGTNGFSYIIPPVKQLPSTGYVLDSAVAALYCFFATTTFEDGALLAVNLGHDADTVGAIFAGIAACWYSADKGDEDGIFWTRKVRAWHKALVKCDLVEKVAKNLASFERQRMR